MSKPDGVVGWIVFQELLDPFEFELRNHPNEVVRPFRPRLNARVERHEIVLDTLRLFLVQIRPFVMAALRRIVAK